MREMDPTIAAGTAIAVEFLMAWAERDQETAATYIDAVLNNPKSPDVPSIVTGQFNVGAALLALLAAERGAVTDDEVRKITSEILRDLAGRISH